MDWSTPWKTLTNAVDSAQKAFDELEQTNTGEKLGPGAESRVERHREGKVGRQSEDFFQTNVTPIEKAETPSIRGEKFLETNAKKKQICRYFRLSPWTATSVINGFPVRFV